MTGGPTQPRRRRARQSRIDRHREPLSALNYSLSGEASQHSQVPSLLTYEDLFGSPGLRPALRAARCPRSVRHRMSAFQPDCPPRQRDGYCRCIPTTSRLGNFPLSMSRDAIKDDALADEIAAVEVAGHVSAGDSRAAIEEAISRRYTHTLARRAAESSTPLNCTPDGIVAPRNRGPKIWLSGRAGWNSSFFLARSEAHVAVGGGADPAFKGLHEPDPRTTGAIS
jgi:hypothetical protein